jgi:hypothetical protein
LEDDEKAPGTKSFQTIIGSPNNIAALNDTVVGFHTAGTRGFSILPQKGWEKPTAICDGGPGGEHYCLTEITLSLCGNDSFVVTNQGAFVHLSHQVGALGGGDIKTDYVMVPTATM